MPVTSGVGQQFDEGCNGTGRDDVRHEGPQFFDSFAMKCNPSFGDSGCLNEKGVLPSVGFHEMLVWDPKDGCHKTGESRAAPEVGPSLRPRWRVAKQLRRVEDMAAPDVR